MGTDAEWGDYVTSDVDYDSITLITCGGDFDAETHGYTKRTLVQGDARIVPPRSFRPALPLTGEGWGGGRDHLPGGARL